MPETLVPAAPSSAPPAALAPIRVRAKFFFEGEKKWFIKGVTYGPFAPDAEGHFVGDPEKARRDFALIQEFGANLLRIYHIPPRWFLDLAREFGLRVLISMICRFILRLFRNSMCSAHGIEMSTRNPNSRARSRNQRGGMW